jgi:homoserine dehydrogenase
MGRDRLIVLKFGSSVLAGPADLPRAVQEIYRWRREGWRVVAVVSAAKGVTDALLTEARGLCPRPQRAQRADATAALAAIGELAAAARLALALDAAGVTAETLDAGALALRTTGECLDASPASLDAGVIHAALDRAGVLVVPGFIGRDEHGRTTLLGRGGSDLSALFIAREIGARCRLLKDTPGLFESDPKFSTCHRDGRSGPSRCEQPQPIRRYSNLTWTDLPRLGTRAVQPKAGVFAWEHKVEFEVAAPLEEGCTRVGPVPTAFDAPRTGADDNARPIRVALLGHGVVGAGVARALVDFGRGAHGCSPRFELVSIAVRTPSRHIASIAELGLEPSVLTTDAAGVLDTRPDLVIECLGGLDPAADIIERALRAGIPVITANKAVIAEHGQRLHDIAFDSGAALAYSGAVGGAVPILELVTRLAARGVQIASIRAVLNGTSNFVLGRLCAGGSLTEAVAAAQAAGFAEADPTRDLSGRDALDKLRILAHAACPGYPGELSSRLVGVDDATATLARDAARRGEVVRQVARLTRTRTGLHLSVAPECINPASDADAPLADLADEANGVVITDADEQRHVLAGRGAGRAPTALSVVADVLDVIARDSRPGRRQAMLSTPALRSKPAPLAAAG